MIVAKRSKRHGLGYAALIASMGIASVLIGSCSSGVGPDGPVVGSACAEQLDCANGSACLMDPDDFPNGMCAKACKTQADCPELSSCVDVNGGYCLLSCDAGTSCTTGIACRAKRNKGDSLESQVCINDDG